MLRSLLLFTIIAAAAAHGDHGHHASSHEQMATGHTPMHGNATILVSTESMLVSLHVFLGCALTFCLIPLAAAFVQSNRILWHKTMMIVNSCLMLFTALLAKAGFSSGESFHGKFAWFTIFMWALHLAYSYVRNNAEDKSKYPILPHRWVGMSLLVTLLFVVMAGILHNIGSCYGGNAPSQCAAHFMLGSTFIIVGTAHVFFSPDTAAKIEVAVMLLGGFGEWIGEGLIDVILFNIDPVTHWWNVHAKWLHLTTATSWFMCGLLGLVLRLNSKDADKRGYAFILGMAVHIFFISNHAQQLVTSQVVHAAHASFLLPVMVLRPLLAQVPVAIFLIAGGFLFTGGAEPVIVDVTMPPTAYPMVIILISVSYTMSMFMVRYFIQNPAVVHVRSSAKGAQNQETTYCFDRLACQPYVRHALFCDCNRDSHLSDAIEYGRVSDSDDDSEDAQLLHSDEHTEMPQSSML